jgi:fructoselysine-6-P-deglycase FrlB-like protein
LTSKMLEEALASCEAVEAQLQRLDPLLVEVAGRLRRQPPQVAMTIARGSSDHAASYFAYLTMQHLGIPVASLPMSVVTMLQSPLKVSGQVAFGFSQSGQSPDLVNSLRGFPLAGMNRGFEVAGQLQVQRRRLFIVGAQGQDGVHRVGFRCGYWSVVAR